MRFILYLVLISLVSGCLCCGGWDDGDSLELTEIQICEDVDDDGYGNGCASYFDEGIYGVYVLIDYTVYGDYDYIYFDWYYNDEWLFDDSFQMGSDEVGADYWIATPLTYGDDPLPAGAYYVEVKQDDTLLATETFTVR